MRAVQLTALDPTARPAPKSRTETFECVECGHRFRHRTIAGIYARCPVCPGRAIGGVVKERLLASAVDRVKDVDAGRAARNAAERERKRKLREGASGDSEVIGPTHPPRRRAPPRIEVLADPPPPPPSPARARSHRPALAAAPAEPVPAPATPPAPAPKRPGLLDRILGVE